MVPLILDTLSGKHKPLDLSTPVKFYVCGPTPYAAAHLGHARLYVTCDVVRKIIERFFNGTVLFAMNITDIDDKIILAAKHHGKTPLEVTQQYEEEFWNDMHALGVDSPDKLMRVTESVHEIQEFVQSLIQKGFAYEQDGSVYFDSAAYKTAGYEYDVFKRLTDGADFALWKRSDRGWESPWSVRGVPGWHVECSTLATAMLGDKIDIHSGGCDLQYPHHTNEVAQSCAYHGSTTWVETFMHVGQLNIDGLKMSKSLKNYTTIRSMLEISSPTQLRLLFLLHRWESTMNFNEAELATVNSIEKALSSCMQLVRGANATNKHDGELFMELHATKKRVQVALEDNLDYVTALHAVVNLARRVVACQDTNCVRKAQSYISFVMSVFGVSVNALKNVRSKSADDTLLVQCVLPFRDRVRALARSTGDNSLFEVCDELRTKLQGLGHHVMDHV